MSTIIKNVFQPKAPTGILKQMCDQIKSFKNYRSAHSLEKGTISPFESVPIILLVTNQKAQWYQFNDEKQQYAIGVSFDEKSQSPVIEILIKLNENDDRFWNTINNKVELKIDHEQNLHIVYKDKPSEDNDYQVISASDLVQGGILQAVVWNIQKLSTPDSSVRPKLSEAEFNAAVVAEAAKKVSASAAAASATAVAATPTSAVAGDTHSKKSQELISICRQIESYSNFGKESPKEDSRRGTSSLNRFAKDKFPAELGTLDTTSEWYEYLLRSRYYPNNSDVAGECILRYAIKLGIDAKTRYAVVDIYAYDLETYKWVLATNCDLRIDTRDKELRIIYKDAGAADNPLYAKINWDLGSTTPSASAAPLVMMSTAGATAAAVQTAIPATLDVSNPRVTGGPSDDEAMAAHDNDLCRPS